VVGAAVANLERSRGCTRSYSSWREIEFSGIITASFETPRHARLSVLCNWMIVNEYPTSTVSLLVLFQLALQPLWVFGLLNCHWVFSAGRFLQSAVASGTSNLQFWGPVIRTLVAEGGTMGEKWPRILSSFTCRKVTTWDRRLYFPSEERRAEEYFARKIRFGRVWTRELGYQRPARYL
jgi:hypothetical protein